MQRIFIAFPVSSEARKEIIHIQNQLKEQNKDVRVAWTKTDTAHVTLLFLGEIDNSVMPAVEKGIMDSLKTVATFSFSLNAYEVFAQSGVVVIRLAMESDSPERFRQALQDVCRSSHIPFDDKPFKPHITLARNKWRADLRGLNEIHVQPIKWQVNEVFLMVSESGRAGHEHRVLRRFELGSREL